MYSLNVPPPSAVTRLASSLARDVPRARARQHGEHTLVCKRLGDGDGARLAARVREALAGVAPFELRVSGIDLFETATTGSAPVVYLDVESPGLRQLHERLCGVFDPVERIEADDYTPHVTIARGGELADARRLARREVEPIRWTAERLSVWDSHRNVSVREFSLPV
ncbi:2'-5' RNA ligase family protein [Halapricum hydrolyticum]|uniref:2'-5' RNA ligase family protein n=1 Tax=Halapricum hydrolyticum TaxID=2979991 RepID=A0AAE3LHW2_9EURY|nr:2'-5' RNA ligase family protein [Halapricum hydrolyticum]MCU4716767.1 2'-5' RNA ligase family protein [Halapricum hydrolyticum]MCU4725628.1 2'-5' RNA ligase family protein [Halapricum hydrolyticum]